MSIPLDKNGVEDGFVTYHEKAHSGYSDYKPSIANDSAYLSRRMSRVRVPSAPPFSPQLRNDKSVTKVTKKVTELTGYFTTDEVAKIEGVSRKAVVSWCESGKIRAERVAKGSRIVWRIPEGYKSGGVERLQSWDAFHAEWVKAQETGYLTGKKIGPRGVEANKYGIKKIWEYLEERPAIEKLTLDNLRQALSNVPIDYKARKCHYTQREQMYKAYRSATKFLILKGLRSRVDLEESKDLAPARHFEPVRDFLSLEEFYALLKFNRDSLAKRIKYDSQLTNIIMCLAGFAGLRASEIVNLRVQDIDFNRKYIQIIDGKGTRCDQVPLMPALEKALLQEWLPVKVQGPYVVTSKAGTQLHRLDVTKRIKRISKKFGKEIKAHSLRHSFISILADSGMPLAQIKEAARHRQLSTVERYVHTNKKAMWEHMTTFGTPK